MGSEMCIRDRHTTLGVITSSTRVMLEKILAAEEEHAEDLANLLVTLDPTKEGS